MNVDPNFSSISSRNSLRRLGRNRPLLPRKAMPDGNTLWGKICQFISLDNENGLFLLVGHPSSGKTTEFRELARRLADDNQVFKESYWPIFSELQNTEFEDGLSLSSLWKSIVLGSPDLDLQTSTMNEIDDFINEAESENKIPIFFVDTLDILMMYEDKDVVSNIWTEFVESVTSRGGKIIWTCRPGESFYYEDKLIDTGNEFVRVDLPPIDKESLKEFSSLVSLSSGKNSIYDSDSNNLQYDKLWNGWTINLQSYMAIYADRWSNNPKSNIKLNEKFFSKLSDFFLNFMKINIGPSDHWVDIAETLFPSKEMYNWLCEEITETLVEIFDYEQELIQNLFSIVEAVCKSVALGAKSHTSRVRLPFDLIHSKLLSGSKNSNLVHDFMNVSESRGLFMVDGKWLDFTHQLLFEESVLVSASENEQLILAKKLPSIDFRKNAQDLRRTTWDKDEHLMKNEILGVLGDWNGYLLSYHPTCVSKNSVLSDSWDKWVDFALENIEIEIDDGEYNENSEKREIMSRYLSNPDKKRPLLLNGAPGTGKTYFAMKFLARNIMENRHKATTRKWRYYTRNDALSDSFNSCWSQEYIVDRPYLRTVNNTNGKAYPIKNLMKFFFPAKIDTKKKWNQITKIGLMDFELFKFLLDAFWLDKSKNKIDKRAGQPSIPDAWQIYNQVFHDPSTGEMRVIESKEDYELIFETENNRSNGNLPTIRGATLEAFIKFKQKYSRGWWTYSHAAYQCREKFQSMTDHEKLQYQVDVLIVDEVQDITPPEMALMLELLKEDSLDCSTLIAGDRVQTVNRSGFEWIDFCTKTKLALKDSKHPAKKDLQKVAIFDDSISKHLFTLQYVWRNGKKIVDYNNHMRKNYANTFGISQKYVELFDYPEGELKISKTSLDRDSDTKITAIEAKNDADYDEIFDTLVEVCNSLTGTNQTVAVLSPYVILNEWNQELPFPVYNCETVKGLEFDAIVVMLPYLLEFEEAKLSTYTQAINEKNEDEEMQKQFQKWADAWNNEKNDTVQRTFENFNLLYLNMMTRMNVIFSRPQKRMLIINPIKGKNAVSTIESGDKELISFGMPEAPSFVKKRPRKVMKRQEEIDHLRELMLDTLALDHSGEEDQKVRVFIELLKSINLNNDGTQPDNERKSWARILDNYEDKEDDLSYVPKWKLFDWLSIDNRYGAKLPDDEIERLRQQFDFRKAVSIIGGVSDSEVQSPSILAGLRSDIHDNMELSFDSVNHFENQYANSLKKIFFAGSTAYIEPDLAYFIIENLEEFAHRLLSPCTGSIDLHNLMLNRIFGIDVSEFEHYDYSDWRKCIIQEFGTSSYSLNDFSTRIGEAGLFELKGNESSLRYKTIYHMAKRFSGISSSDWVWENLGTIDRSKYKDETVPLWQELTKVIDGFETIEEINLFFILNSNLSNWISEQLKSPSYIAKFSQTTVSGWKDIIESGRATEMHKFALMLKEKQNWSKEPLHIPIKSMKESKKDGFGPIKITDLYISCYEALNIDFDDNALILIHEYAEHRLRQLWSNSGLTQIGKEIARDKLELTEDPITGSLLQGTLPLNIDLKFVLKLMREDTILKKSRVVPTFESRSKFYSAYIRDLWDARGTGYKNELSKSENPYSYIGAMICASMFPSENAILRLIPLVDIIDNKLNRLFDESQGLIDYTTDGAWLRKNNQKYVTWLKNNFEDYLFRDLFADLISMDILGVYSPPGSDTVSTKYFLENTELQRDRLSVIHSRLMMYDFIITSSKTCPRNFRISVGHSDRFEPKYDGRISSLTEAIYHSAGRFVNKRQFYRIYISDLDSLLDKRSVKKAWNDKKKKDRDTSTDKFRNDRPSRFINLKIFESWEWLLYLMNKYANGSFSCLWKKFDDSIRDRGTYNDWRRILHDYLRMNWNVDDDIDRIGSKIYESQYEQIEEFASKQLDRSGLQFMYENILDFTEISDYKFDASRGKLGIKWATAQRAIYTQYQKRINPHWNKNYIDWEVSYILSRHDKKNRDSMYPQMVDSFEEQIKFVLDIMNNGVLNLLDSGTTESSLIDILEAGSDDSHGVKILESLVTSILESDIKFSNIFNIPLKNFNRAKKSYFGKEMSKSPVHRRIRRLLAEKFLEFLMSELSTKLSVAGLSLNKTYSQNKAYKDMFGSAGASNVEISAHRRIYSIE